MGLHVGLDTRSGMLEGKYLAKVTAYLRTIVIEGVDLDFRHKRWFPAGGGKIGCVVGDTAQFLGVSEEAIHLLESIKRNHDAIGDVTWWRANDGLDYFAWVGGKTRLVDPDDAEAARDFRIRDYNLIPNDTPEEAKRVIREYKMAG